MFVHKYNQVLFWSCFQQAEICIWASLRCFPCSCKQLRYSDFTFSASASAHYFLFINPRLILFCHKATLELCPSVVLFRLLGCTVRLTAAQIWVSFFFFSLFISFPPSPVGLHSLAPGSSKHHLARRKVQGLCIASGPRLRWTMAAFLCSQSALLCCFVWETGCIVVCGWAGLSSGALLGMFGELH